MLLDNEDFLIAATEMMATETYQRLVSIAIDEFAAARGSAGTQWEYESNKASVAGARDFISFLNRMVIDRVEREVDDDDGSEPEHAEA